MSAVSSTLRAHFRMHSEKSAISLSWMGSRLGFGLLQDGDVRVGIE
jgi:hypothetical protein